MRAQFLLTIPSPPTSIPTTPSLPLKAVATSSDPGTGLLASYLLALAEADAQRRARRAMVNILELEWEEGESEDLPFSLGLYPGISDLQLRLRLLGPSRQT